MINLSQPYVTDSMRRAVQDTLRTKWVGQGPKVTEFEEKFQKQLKTLPAVAVGSGTDALHLAYILAGIQPGDEVLTPVYTCAATNLPLLWLGAKIVFVDIDKETLNIDPEDIKRKITKDTKALVTTDITGMACDYDAIKLYDVPIINDAANSIGAPGVGCYGDYTAFSFMAIKHITTGDGGMITMHEQDMEKAKRLRWFGIDRNKKLDSLSKWDEDITEIGYKYQMTDIAASMGMAGLDTLDDQLKRRAEMVDRYGGNSEGSANWLRTILVENRDKLIHYLNDKGVQSSPMYYRNDRYSIFKKFSNHCPNMDELEDQILCLPLHMHLLDTEIDMINSLVTDFYYEGR